MNPRANSNTNILTGVNNSGKTTILEAISLWNEIFSKLVFQAQKSDGSLGISSGDYRLGRKNQNYIDYRDINSVRSFGYKDIFYKLDDSKIIKLSATIFIDEANDLEICFIMKLANGNNYNVYLDKHDDFNFSKFNEVFSTLPESIGCYFSTPVATISSFEEFAITPKIEEGIKIRKSSLFFRNRLFKLYKYGDFEGFKKVLSKIVYNEFGLIDFKINGDISKDIYILIDVNLKGTGFRNISLLGSGTIQIIEILLHIYESNKELNIILLDEPDSHIHRDIQKRLLNFLKDSEVQVFLTTHNESLIRSANPNNLFFIDDTVSNEEDTIIEPVVKIKLPQRQIGIENSHHSKIMNQIGSETSLDILNALEADKIIFVEGVGDSEYIQKLMEVKNIDKECVFWSFRGLDNLLKRIKYYKEFFESLGSNQSIWDKCSIVIDADFMTDVQKEKLKLKLESKLKIPVFIWKTYTIEGTILLDINKLEQLMKNECTKQNITVTQQTVNSKIQESLDILKEQKLTSLDQDEKFCVKVTGQIESRIKNLHENLDIQRKYIFDKITLIESFNHYRIFAKKELDANRVSHICDKDDVEKILKLIFNNLNIEKDPLFSNYFSFIFNTIDSHFINSEWDELLEFISE
ncbi:ATP-dependent nuclease [Polaribacter sp. L3A8]|uniref:ATP-dependent nuclease n=1 Tax=Polaribacter sp. L3A8 TaxID=2686361 RepID=UPI00131C8454|nr:ATP-binding protein [Polaribacter sp. L3A8]